MIFPVLKNVFEKRPACFESFLDADTVLQRLESIVKRGEFRNFMNDCLVGKVSRESLIIAHRRPGERNPVRPTFFGVLRVTDRSTVVDGYFAYSWIARSFLLYGLGFVVLLVTTLLVFAVGISVFDKPFWVGWSVPIIIFAVAALVAFGALRASQPLSQEDIKWISTRLRAELDAI